MNIYPRWLGGYPENNQGHAGKYGTHMERINKFPVKHMV